MKSIFAVVAVDRPEAIAGAIAREFPDDSIELDRGQWLVSAEGTSQHVSERLGLISRTPEGKVSKGTMGSALVLAVSGYYGIKSANIWEWIKAHWETS